MGVTDRTAYADVVEVALRRAGRPRAVIYCAVNADSVGGVVVGVSGHCSPDDAVMSMGVLSVMERRVFDAAGF